jgi:hypothetical protein
MWRSGLASCLRPPLGSTWARVTDLRSHLDGCLDVDLESSALTNAFPAHRLGLDIGEATQAPAAYVRAADLSVERLEQRYFRLDNGPRGERYRYTAPAFDFECDLTYDEVGLVLDYPGLAIRAA